MGIENPFARNEKRDEPESLSESVPTQEVRADEVDPSQHRIIQNGEAHSIKTKTRSNEEILFILQGGGSYRADADEMVEIVERVFE